MTTVIVQPPDTTTVVVNPVPVTKTTAVTPVTTVVEIDRDAQIGPQGPAGDVATSTYTGVAGETLSGHRWVVEIDGVMVYADAANPTHMRHQPCMTLHAAVAGDAVQVATHGPVTESSWSWPTDTQIVVGPAGALATSTAAGFAWLRVAALATSPTSVFIAPQHPIRLHQE